MATKPLFIPDDSQIEAIQAFKGYHLVLAAPGCGKTQILTERVKYARKKGIEYEDMLCLTFTNRAARGMLERITENIAEDNLSKLYVGNIHRFCSKFLFENNLISTETSIIDEDEAYSILAQYFDDNEIDIAKNYKQKRSYDEIIHFSHFMQQIIFGHPKELRQHPECLTRMDIQSMSTIFRIHKIAFTAEAMIDMYKNTDQYRELTKSDAFDIGTIRSAENLLNKMEAARYYDTYKQSYHMADFADLLIFTYDTLARHPKDYHHYKWIQIDEVQDLNPLQLAIIDAISDKENPQIMYLGDEQQAIFSFMGAKLDTLDFLKRRCTAGNIHHLDVNHRSPAYLLHVFNTYATNILNIDAELLPKAVVERKKNGHELQIWSANTFEDEFYLVADKIQEIRGTSKNETTAVIVNSNADADKMSQLLMDRHISHFKISGEDLFNTESVRLLFAHLNILNNENNFIAWTRLLKGIGICQTHSSARLFMKELQERAMRPTDFLLYENSTYIQEFVRDFHNREFVVFDTETTGLDVFEEDIVQIAALKMKDGKIIPNSQFTIFIDTSRTIPQKLGDIENPIIEERKHHKIFSAEEALSIFLEYVGDDILLGHNVEYDYQILSNNLKRYLPDYNLAERHPIYYDTLKICKLLHHRLKQFKLKYLLKVFNLEGENSHLADADVEATANVLSYLYSEAKHIISKQKEFISMQKTSESRRKLKAYYQEFYLKGIENLYKREEKSKSPLLDTLQDFQTNMQKEGVIRQPEQIRYIFDFLVNDLLAQQNGLSLKEELDSHIMTLNTLKEADLCGSDSIKENIFVTTVHKAKGLEFDNIIIFDAIDGRYPNFYSEGNAKAMAEDARKFYVAMTRAKKRLFVSYCQAINRNGYAIQKKLTRFMLPLLHLFTE